MTHTTNLTTTCTLQLREKKQTPCGTSFEATLIEAVDKSFSSFGQYCKQAIYLQLENTFKIKKQEIPYKIAEFAISLRKIFGVGAKLIELKIIGALHEKIRDFTYFPEKDDLVFTEYIESLRIFLRPQL